uniref:Capsid protein n=1 Tax=Rhizoctonia solani partitivirus 11 TaxID=2870787 RepID=A0A8K1HTF7_9VIRU|nr:capsid protein [Rhizoctonia solani partitivirus 11]
MDTTPVQPASTVPAKAAQGSLDHASVPVPLGTGPSTASAPAVLTAPKSSAPFHPRGNSKKEKPTSGQLSRPGLASILKLTGRVPIFNVDNYVDNTFVPSSIALMHTVNLMDRTMVMTHRFLQGAPLWNTYLTKAYVGLLMYIHAFRIERAAGLLIPAHQDVLRTFESYFALDSLMIPGPVVPFFEAMGVSAPYSDQLTDVFARFPNETGASGSNAFLLDFAAGTQQRVPSPMACMDQYYRILESVAAQPTDHNQSELEVIAENDIPHHVPRHFYRTTANTQNSRWCQTIPEFRFPPPLSYSIVQSNRSFAHLFPRSEQGTVLVHHPDPGADVTRPTSRYRLASFNNTNQLDWYQYLYLRAVGTRPIANWVGPASAIMQRYCEFFKDSVSLDSIPVTSSGAGQVEVAYTAASGISAGNPTQGTLSRINSLECTVRHVHPTMIAVPLPMQIASLTQVNASGFAFADATSRTGPLWDVRPYVQQSTAFDMMQAVEAHVAAHYHSDTRIN